MTSCLLALLAVLCLGGPAAASESALGDSESRELIDVIEKNTLWARQGLQQMKSDHLDRLILLERLDYDVDAINRWIIESTQWVPYTGRLRGADGVLMDRRGNSLDRSLLFTALLEDAGFETRLVRAELSAETAETLLRKHLGEQVRPVGRQLERSARLLALQEELEANSRSLASLAGLTDEAESVSDLDRALAATRDHWWVQLKDGPAWIDLDPLIPGASALTRPAANRTFSSPADLPIELQHSLTIRVIVERWEAGQLFEEVALSYELTPRDAARGHTLEFELQPFSKSWLGDDVPPDTGELVIAEEAELWLPILHVDNVVVETGDWVSRAGTLEKDPMRWAGEQKLERAVGALGKLGDAAEGSEPESHLTAVWLDYDIHRPGAANRRVRRELSDILGVDRQEPQALRAWMIDDHARRSRGLALQTHSIALVHIAAPHPAALEKAIYERWIENRSFLIALVYQAAGWEDDRIEPSLRQEYPYPVDLLAQMTARYLWSLDRGRIYPDEINVWSNHLLWRREGSSVEAVLATDIVTNHVGVLASAPLDRKLLRIQQGMLDTFIEQHMSTDEGTHNAYGRFVDRERYGDEWRSVSVPRGLGTLHELPASERSRLARAIDSGARVVVSEEVSQSGDQRFPHWWQIDSADGTTLGRGYRGWGAQLTENRAVHQVPGKVLRAHQKRQVANRACKVGEAIVKVANAVTVIQNPVMIDINYVIQLEKRSLYVTQRSSGLGKICR